MIPNRGFIGLAALFLGACQQVTPPDGIPVDKADMIQIHAEKPAGNQSGQCWDQDATPALVETVTEQVLVRPAGPSVEASPDGAPTYRTVDRPAEYRTQSEQRIVRERIDVWFEVPCPPVMDTAFIATLQRALKSRGLFRGAINGTMDNRTKQALRKFQRPRGLDSGILSTGAARQLGIVAYIYPESK